MAGTGSWMRASAFLRQRMDKVPLQWMFLWEDVDVGCSAEVMTCTAIAVRVFPNLNPSCFSKTVTSNVLCSRQRCAVVEQIKNNCVRRVLSAFCKELELQTGVFKYSWKTEAFFFLPLTEAAARLNQVDVSVKEWTYCSTLHYVEWGLRRSRSRLF